MRYCGEKPELNRFLSLFHSSPCHPSNSISIRQCHRVFLGDAAHLRRDDALPSHKRYKVLHGRALGHAVWPRARRTADLLGDLVTCDEQHGVGEGPEIEEGDRRWNSLDNAGAAAIRAPVQVPDHVVHDRVYVPVARPELHVLGHDTDVAPEQV